MVRTASPAKGRITRGDEPEQAPAQAAPRRSDYGGRLGHGQLPHRARLDRRAHALALRAALEVHRQDRQRLSRGHRAGGQRRGRPGDHDAGAPGRALGLRGQALLRRPAVDAAAHAGPPAAGRPPDVRGARRPWLAQLRRHPRAQAGAAHRHAAARREQPVQLRDRSDPARARHRARRHRALGRLVASITTARARACRRRIDGEVNAVFNEAIMLSLWSDWARKTPLAFIPIEPRRDAARWCRTTACARRWSSRGAC